MPELPEVETVRRTLAPAVEGRRILAARFLSPLCAGGAPAVLASRLAGQTIHRLRRAGKHLLFELDRGLLDAHLRMTGKFLLGGAEGPYTRAVLELENGPLLFDDIRQFGRLRWLESDDGLEALGPDALDLDAKVFARLLRGRRGRVKPLLLDQRFVSGLGNIYVDEALFRARLHPLTPAARIGPRRAARLHQAIQDTLREAIGAGGTSISDYVDARGARGEFQQRLRVYARAGQPCPECGAPIRRMVVAQRGTHFCPACQRPG